MTRLYSILSVLLLISLNGLAQSYSNTIAFSHESGFYENNFAFSMESKNGDPIYYTLNGSNPSEKSIQYEGKIPMSSLIFLKDTFTYIPTSLHKIRPAADPFKANIIRAVSIKNGQQTSAVYSKTIFVTLGEKHRYPNVDLLSIIVDPSSLFHRDSGIYVPGAQQEIDANSGNYEFKGRKWERESCIQLLNENGEFQFEQNVGIRIHGRIRRTTQKSLRISARSQYGASFINHSILPESKTTKHKKLLLRNSLGCWQKTLFKDLCTQHICRDLDMDIPRGRPVIVYINGEYWGIHAFQEHFNDDYLSLKFGIDKDSVNIIDHGVGHANRDDSWGVEAGTADSHIKMYNVFHAMVRDKKVDVEKLEKYLDFNNLIDYYCVQIFLNNRDWPGNNNVLWSQGANGKWRHAFLDLDAAWTHPEMNTFSLLMSSSSSAVAPAYSKYLFQNLISSESFANRFFNRLGCLIRNELSEDSLLLAIDRYTELYTPLMKEHIGRWQRPGSVFDWTKGVNQLRHFAKSRAAFIVDHVKETFAREFEPADCTCD